MDEKLKFSILLGLSESEKGGDILIIFNKIKDFFDFEMNKYFNKITDKIGLKSRH